MLILYGSSVFSVWFTKSGGTCISRALSSHMQQMQTRSALSTWKFSKQQTVPDLWSKPLPRWLCMHFYNCLCLDEPPTVDHETPLSCTLSDAGTFGWAVHIPYLYMSLSNARIWWPHASFFFIVLYFAFLFSKNHYSCTLPLPSWIPDPKCIFYS